MTDLYFVPPYLHVIHIILLVYAGECAIAVFLKWSDIMSKNFQMLISSNHFVADLAIMNNLADSLTWLLLFEVPHLLRVSYMG